MWAAANVDYRSLTPSTANTNHRGQDADPIKYGPLSLITLLHLCRVTSHHGMVWCGTRHGVVWYGMAWHGVVWCSVV